MKAHEAFKISKENIASKDIESVMKNIYDKIKEEAHKGKFHTEVDVPENQVKEVQKRLEDDGYSRLNYSPFGSSKGYVVLDIGWVKGNK